MKNLTTMKAAPNIPICAFQVECIQDYVEDGILYWQAGRSYNCQTKDFDTFAIETEEKEWGLVGNAYSCDSFFDYFKTDFKINFMPFPLEWLSDKVIQDIGNYKIFRDTLADIITYATDKSLNLTPEEVEKAARLYAYEKKYDCNLDYWANIEAVINLATEEW